ncbi:hypothetical protein ACSSS7_005694 [Eimeria intestinalis]
MPARLPSQPEENEAEKTGNGATSAPANSQQAVSTGSSKVFDGNTTSSLCPAGGGQRNVGRRAERPQASSSVTATEGAGCNCAHEATPTGHPSNAQAQSPEARRGRITQLVKEHREALLLSLLSDEWIPNYTGLLYRQSVCWQLPLTEVQHIHNVFYEYLNDYHFAMHTQELCLGLWDHNPRLMLPGEQALGGEWVKKVLSQAAITPQQQESQRRIRNLQRLHLEIKEIQLEEYRQSLRALLRLPPVIEPSPTSRAQ